MTLFDPTTGQFVTISPPAQGTEMSCRGASVKFEQIVQSDRHENVPLKRHAGIISMKTSEQPSSRAASFAAVLAVLGALGTLYLPLLWA